MAGLFDFMWNNCIFSVCKLIQILAAYGHFSEEHHRNIALVLLY